MKTLFGIAYLLVYQASLLIAAALTPQRKGHIEEYPDELGLWWVDDD